MANLEKLKKHYGNVIWTGKKCILGLPISLTRYILTDTTLYTRFGLLNINEDEVDLYRIIDKKLMFPFKERMFFCGSILVTSKDADTPSKRIQSIKKVREVKRIFDEAIQEQRDKYLVRGRDMVGAHGDFGDNNDGNDYND